jgi:hypothetical protein
VAWILPISSLVDFVSPHDCAVDIVFDQRLMGWVYSDWVSEAATTAFIAPSVQDWILSCTTE